MTQETSHDRTTGPGAAELGDDDLLRELEHLHETRHETLRHGSESALTAHTHRMEALEQEYLRRNPRREVDPDRLRSGRRDDTEER
jgi:hypothetical protein